MRQYNRLLLHWLLLVLVLDLTSLLEQRWHGRATSQGGHRRPNIALLELARHLLDCGQVRTQCCTRPFVVHRAVHAPFGQRWNKPASPGRTTTSKDITNSRSRVSLAQLYVERIVVESDLGFGRGICRVLVCRTNGQHEPACTEGGESIARTFKRVSTGEWK